MDYITGGYPLHILLLLFLMGTGLADRPLSFILSGLVVTYFFLLG